MAGKILTRQEAYNIGGGGGNPLLEPHRCCTLSQSAHYGCTNQHTQDYNSNRLIWYAEGYLPTTTLYIITDIANNASKNPYLVCQYELSPLTSGTIELDGSSQYYPIRLNDYQVMSSLTLAFQVTYNSENDPYYKVYDMKMGFDHENTYIDNLTNHGSGNVIKIENGTSQTIDDVTYYNPFYFPSTEMKWPGNNQYAWGSISWYNYADLHIGEVTIPLEVSWCFANTASSITYNITINEGTINGAGWNPTATPFSLIETYAFLGSEEIVLANRYRSDDNQSGDVTWNRSVNSHMQTISKFRVRCSMAGYVNVISITANIGGVLVNGRSNISSSTPQTSYEINLDSTVQIRKDTTINNISITVN